MAKTSGELSRHEQKESSRESDSTKPGKPSMGVDKVGGKSGQRFSVPNHPEKCDVAKGPGGKMD